MNYKEIDFSVKNYLLSHIELVSKLDVDMLEAGIDIIKEKFEAGKKIITCGNGGSASTASHYITDWNKMVNLATGKKFRGIDLCDNVVLLTAYANGLSYDDVYSGQLMSILDKGDLLIAISGSGNSPNILKAVNYANSAGATTLAVVGYDGGKLKEIAQFAVWVQSYDMQLCEDLHLMFGHMVMKSLSSCSIKQ